MIEAIVTLVIPAKPAEHTLTCDSDQVVYGVACKHNDEPAHTTVFRLEFESEREAMEWLESPGDRILSLELMGGIAAG